MTETKIENQNAESNSGKKDTLSQKILNIQAEIKSIKKDQLNSFQKYKFFTKAQVIEVVKPLLKKEKITLLITDDHDFPETCEKDDKGRWVSKFRKKMEVIDNEAGKQRTFYYRAYGINDDPAKAKGAANTYALKYILSEFFLMAIHDERDPDYTPDYSNKDNKDKVDEGKPKPLTEEEKKQVADLLDKHGLAKVWKTFNSTTQDLSKLSDDELHKKHQDIDPNVWIKNCKICIKLDNEERLAKDKQSEKEKTQDPLN